MTTTKPSKEFECVLGHNHDQKKLLAIAKKLKLTPNYIRNIRDITKSVSEKDSKLYNVYIHMIKEDGIFKITLYSTIK